MRKTGNESTHERAWRLSEVALASLRAGRPRARSAFAADCEMRNMYVAGYAAALEDVVGVEERRGRKR